MYPTKTDVDEKEIATVFELFRGSLKREWHLWKVLILVPR